MPFRLAGALVLGATGLVCGACSDYLARRDTASRGSGDAVQTNMAIHTIDPWPAVAQRTDTAADGERLQHAMERYRNPSSAPAPAAATGSAGTGGATLTR